VAAIFATRFSLTGVRMLDAEGVATCIGLFYVGFPEAVNPDFRYLAIQSGLDWPVFSCL
jgi:hypothetical protein